MYKKLIFLMSSFLTFSGYLYAMEDNPVPQKIVPESPEIENIKYPKDRDPFSIAKFEVGDIIDSRDSRLGLEIAKSYSDNRQNRVFDEGSNKSITKHVMLKTRDIANKLIIFDILETTNSNPIGILKINLNKHNDTIYVELIKSDLSGYGLAALNMLISFFEKNINIYQEKTHWELQDLNKVKSQLVDIQLHNLYEKLGFSSINREKKIEYKKIIDSINLIKIKIDKINKNETGTPDEENNDLFVVESELEKVKEKLFTLSYNQVEFDKKFKTSILYRPRFLNNLNNKEEWKREGSIDQKKDHYKTPYWSKHPIKH